MNNKISLSYHHCLTHWASSLLCVLILLSPLSLYAATVDYSGTWVPAYELSEPWDVNKITFTAVGKQAYQDFDPQVKDSTAFCMPYGTPRNTLNSAQDPLEILQRPEQITVIFDRLGDVRRIFMDGRGHPEDPIPGWMGHSTGAWEGDVLVVDTVAMTAESILTEQGLPHSDLLYLNERISLVEINQESLLQIEMVLTDSEFYTAPIEAVRYFRRAPYAQMSTGSALCLLDQWRSSLESMNSELYRRNLELSNDKEAQ